MSNYELRRKAMDLLRERYSIPIAYVFITIIIESIISSLSAPGTIDDNYVIVFTAAERFWNLVVSVFSLVVAGGIAYGGVHIWRSIVLQATPSLEVGIVSGFKTRFGRNVGLQFLMTLYIALWSLLLVIPGIVKSYAYSMAFYLVNREPELTASAALRRSEQLTYGAKSRLFALDLSYLGWYFLGLFTFGILWLWVMPRHNVARMLVYEDLYEADARRHAPPADAAFPEPSAF